MKVTLIKLGLAAATVVAATAFAVPLASQAAELPLKAKAYKAPPPVAPMWSWSGFYAGVNFGYGWSNDSAAFAPGSAAAAVFFTGAAVPASVGTKPSGMLAGAQIGYNFQMAPQWVLGFEADIDWADITGKGTTSTTAAGFAPFTTFGDQRLTALDTVRARFGYAVDRMLIYATGGLALGRTQLNSSIVGLVGGACGPAGLCAVSSSSHWQTGWTAGAGIEWSIAPAWSFKAEYLHYDLGSVSQSQFDPAIPGTIFTSSGGFSGDIVRAGLNFRFGSGGPIVTRY